MVEIAGHSQGHALEVRKQDITSRIKEQHF